VRRDVRVLVVSGESLGTTVADELSSLAGMDAEQAGRTAAALDALDTGRFDCVVCDGDLPGTGGVELFERLRERGDDAPFVLLAAAGNETVANEAIAAGVTDYVPRSLDDFGTLGARIRTIVARRRAERDLRHERALHESLWAVTQELVHASTRAEIDRSVCRRLAAGERFAFAWVSDGVHARVPRAVAGIDPADLQRVRERLSDREPSPTAEALADRTVRAATVAVPEGGLAGVDVLAVPLRHRGGTYGVLGLGLDTEDGLGEGGREAIERLGATVGHALAAVETERAVETFREAVDQADVAIVITDTDGAVEYVNRAFEAITGYTVEEARRLSLADVVEWDEERAAAVRERVAGGESVREETVQHRRDGTQFRADLSVAPIAIDGEVEKFVAVESDVTDLRSHEQRLQVLNRILRHNLRNDLNVIQGRLSLLLDRTEDPEARSHADRAQEKLADLLSMSEKVRSADRAIRAAHDSEARAPLALEEALDRTARQVRDAYPGATVAVEAHEGAVVRATNLDVAVEELLVNAVEHNDDDPHVTVRTTRSAAPEGFLAVEVTDDGPGIPELEREVLERGDETPLEHGRSLGLWLVSWIVGHAGGDLEIDDAPGGGTVVRLIVPRADRS
jgi:PAS domain S-box-containing protein